jgi:uncharacterized protein YkwD
MIKLPLLLCILALLAGVVAPLYGQSAESPALAELEADVIARINVVRHEHSLPPLVPNPVLNALARAHTKDMAEGREKLGHSGFSDRFDAAKDKIPGLNAFGENVAFDFPQTDVVADTVKNWMGSPVHRENILREFTLTGVGVWRDSKGNVYFTQIFGAIR